MFVLNPQQLQPFDVLLVRFPGDAISARIRANCNSEFSHAAVYIGNHAFIEGVSPVVLLFSAQRYYFPTLADVRVIRLKAEFRVSFAVQEAENTIRSLAYCNYSERLLIRIGRQAIDEEIKARFLREHRWTGGVVCSTLVSLPYYAGGIDISQRQEPFYVHFGDIEQSTFFEEVTSQVFEESAEAAGATDYFSGAETGSIQEKQSAAVEQLNKLVENLLRELKSNRQRYAATLQLEDQDLAFTTWEDILPLIARWFATEKGQELDELVYQELLATGYTRLWFEEVHYRRQLFFPFRYFMTALYEGGQPMQLLEHYETTRTALALELERNEQAEERVFENFTVAPAKTLHALLDMYRSYNYLLRSSVTQYDGLLQQFAPLRHLLGGLAL